VTYVSACEKLDALPANPVRRLVIGSQSGSLSERDRLSERIGSQSGSPSERIAPRADLRSSIPSACGVASCARAKPGRERQSGAASRHWTRQLRQQPPSSVVVLPMASSLSFAQASLVPSQLQAPGSRREARVRGMAQGGAARGAKAAAVRDVCGVTPRSIPDVSLARACRAYPPSPVKVEPYRRPASRLPVAVLPEAGTPRSRADTASAW